MATGSGVVRWSNKAENCMNGGNTECDGAHCHAFGPILVLECCTGSSNRSQDAWLDAQIVTWDTERWECQSRSSAVLVLISDGFVSSGCKFVHNSGTLMYPGFS